MPPVSSRRPPVVDALERRTLMSGFTAVVIDGVSDAGPPPRPGPSPALSPPAIRVTLDYRFDAGNFFDAPQKRDALRRAVDDAVRVLRGLLGAIEPAAPLAWDATLEDPATGQQAAVRNLAVGAGELVIYPGSRELDEDAGTAAAGDGLSRGVPGGFTTADTPWTDPAVDWAAWDGKLRQRVAWGGSLAFDPTPDRPWHFDPAAAPAEGAYDFATAATRAVAQVLGFGTSDRWMNWRTRSDDFLNPLADPPTFEGPLTVAAHNAPGDESPVPLDPTGRYFPDTGDGDAPASAMRATLRPGQRFALSSLDYAALQDVGWQPVNRVSASVPPRAPTDVTSPVLIDVTYDGVAPWGPQQLRLYPPYNSVFAAPPPVYEGPPLYAYSVAGPQALGATSQRITYAFNPPGGTWDASETGHFLVALEGTPEAGRIGDFIFDPGTPPATKLQTTNLTVPGPAPHRLVVSHEDNQQVDLSSLAVDDLLVTGPGGAELAAIGSAVAPGVGPPRRDFLAQPPGGAWGPEDNGTYTVSLRPGRVRDAAGNVSPGGTLGTFEVAIRPSSLPGTRLVEPGSGRAVTVTLRGPGTITVYPAEVGAADVGRVELTGTTEASTLLIEGPGEGYAGAYVREIVSSGSLGAILAPTLRLDGPVTVAGALRRLRLGGSNGGSVHVGPGRGLDALIGRAVGLTLDSQSPIRSLAVGAWLKPGGADGASRIVAPSIKSITSLDRRGSFEADVVTGSIGRARFAGALSNATLRAADAIGPVSAVNVDNSRIFAGVRGGVTALPASAADFANPAAFIKAVSVKGLFSRSAVAAPAVGRVSLQSVWAGAGGGMAAVATGVAANRVAAVVRATGALRLVRLDEPADSRVEGDLTVRLL